MDPLLQLLQRNARETPANLARMLALDEAEVSRRIADYEAQEIILGYQAIVNEDKLNLDRVSAVIEVKITPEREGGFDRVATRISKFPEVDSLYLMSGSYDLLVVVKGDNLRAVATFVSEKLATIEGVLSTATHFMLKAYKEKGVMMRAEWAPERLSVSP